MCLLKWFIEENFDIYTYSKYKNQQHKIHQEEIFCVDLSCSRTRTLAYTHVAHIQTTKTTRIETYHEVIFMLT